jgi:hypothetical protein
MTHRGRPRNDGTPSGTPLVLTPAALRTARAELALAFLQPLLETRPPLPVKVQQRLTTVQAKLQRLVHVLRQSEADRPWDYSCARES